MEIALVISSIAGAATAATFSKFPKNKSKMPLLGATSQIRSQIDSLKIEKDILTKTISRLHQEGTDLTKVQRDKLLTRYQHQLGVILARIEKLEEASKYPDLGPLGDGLMSLMDQKLSALDKRLAEISSKIAVSQTIQEKVEPKEKKVEIKSERPAQTVAPSAKNFEEIIKSFSKPTTRFELTTLTAIPPSTAFEIPTPQETLQPKVHPAQIPVPEVAQVPPTKAPQPQEQMEEAVRSVKPETAQQSIAEPIDLERKVREEPPKLEYKDQRPEPERKKPKVNIPEPEEAEDDEDDLDSIKREIMKTLSKLEQAEVE